MEQAATRWGRVNFRLQADLASKTISGHVQLARAGSPKEIHVKLRLPAGSALQGVTVNGSPIQLAGLHGDTAVIATGSRKTFDIHASLM